MRWLMISFRGPDHFWIQIFDYSVFICIIGISFTMQISCLYWSVWLQLDVSSWFRIDWFISFILEYNMNILTFNPCRLMLVIKWWQITTPMSQKKEVFGMMLLSQERYRDFQLGFLNYCCLHCDVLAKYNQKSETTGVVCLKNNVLC